eukprot:4741560-Ditylum_brightwellii.AAC.1
MPTVCQCTEASMREPCHFLSAKLHTKRIISAVRGSCLLGMDFHLFRSEMIASIQADFLPQQETSELTNLLGSQSSAAAFK